MFELLNEAIITRSDRGAVRRARSIMAAVTFQTMKHSLSFRVKHRVVTP